ncbi:Colicin I receptor [Dyella sp. AD56]|uniref:TonB-dependent receptor n=1 Tax=Dyella sp. AD56 TaxID=1528744 RepID=UPI000CB2E412|nr:TonB-dependent receptor [Dyella sp. AD56]PMQ04659.1 Colicin I receptor [Dyella sp. AD56]
MKRMAQQQLYRSLALVLAGAGLGIQGLHAQDTSSPPSSASSPGTSSASTSGSPKATNPTTKPTELQAVVVTATKREESVEKIPATINAITADDLDKRGTQNINDIVKLVPGISVTSAGNGDQRITVRGISSEANTNPTTGLLFDDLSLTDYYAPRLSVDPNPFDMQDVEVLKGPQGTLYGAAALNGAVRYVPNQPEFGQWGGKYYLQYGAVDGGSNAFGGGAALNLPLDKSNRLALRVVAYDQALPGYIDNTQLNRKDSERGRQTGGRAILAWKPIDPLNIQLMFANQENKRDDDGLADNRNGDLVNSVSPRLSPNSQRFNLASLKVDYDFGKFKLISESGYVRKDLDQVNEGSNAVVAGGIYPIANTIDQSRSSTASQEIRLVSNNPDSPWNWVAGIYGMRQQIRGEDVLALGSPSLPVPTTVGLLNQVLPDLGNAWYLFGQPDYVNIQMNIKVREEAAFFDVSRDLGDGFNFGLGGRFYRAFSGGWVNNTGLLVDISGHPQGLLNQGTVHNDGFNPKAALSWNINDNAMLYTSVSKGYRVGGLQWGTAGLFSVAPVPNQFKTDTIWNYEFGLRSQWLDRTLSFDATAFYENWKNPQVLVFVADGLSSYIDNVGRVVSKGVELSSAYLPRSVPGLSFHLSATYDSARTKQPFEVSTGQIEPSGTPWPLSPKWQTAATADYQHSLGSSWYIGGYLSQAFIGRTSYGINQPDSIYGYSEYDAQIRLGTSSLPTYPEFSLTVTNLTNKHGITSSYSGFADVGGVPWHDVNYMQPRTFMLRVTGSF